MDEKEKNIASKVADRFPKLDEKWQNYIFGIIDGLEMARDSQRDKQLQEA